MRYRCVTEWVTGGAGYRVAHILPLNRAKRPSGVNESFRKQLKGKENAEK